MNSQDIKNAISGVLVVDKPVGMTSHDVEIGRAHV